MRLRIKPPSSLTVLAQPETEGNAPRSRRFRLFGAWIFKALAVYRPISLSGTREQTAAPTSIGSMSPATLSFGMVASLQCPLPFHMAELL
jgi:hypothetical protein